MSKNCFSAGCLSILLFISCFIVSNIALKEKGPCPRGSYFSEDDNDCILCPRGRYGDTMGLTSSACTVSSPINDIVLFTK